MTVRETVLLIVAVVLGIVAVAFATKPIPLSKELIQAREKAAINLCVDNGGQAQFRYDQGADHLVFIGCTFSRGQERP